MSLGGIVAGLTPGEILTSSAGQGLGALLGAMTMRWLARRCRPDSRTREWFVFLAGVAVYSASVSTVILASSLAGLVAVPQFWSAPLCAAAFVPFGLLTLGPVLLNLREYPKIRADLRPTGIAVALAVVLLALLGLMLSLPQEMVSPSGATLFLAVPFCLWVAMQDRTLDGAAVSFLASHAALYMILRQAGSVETAHFVTTVLYLNLLIMTCQLVHSVNRDRLAALADLAAHKAELELRVAQRTQRLALMTERALAADAAKTRFLATVSHEVRTPLNGVIGMASVLLSSHLDETQRRNVTMIRTSGMHLLEVINRILDYFRLDQAPEAHDDIDFDLREVVDEVLDEARFSPHAEGLDLRAEIAPGLPAARHGYRQGLRQILTNLVGNAAKFTERGSVTVRVLAGPQDGVRLEVEDTGIGIPADRRDEIFQPYEQVDNSIARRFGGTGLGLAICAELASRMGGRIGVLGEEGAGSVFWVELPLARAAAQVSRAEASLAG